jgi:hypothetical protein
MGILQCEKIEFRFVSAEEEVSKNLRADSRHFLSNFFLVGGGGECAN